MKAFEAKDLENKFGSKTTLKDIFESFERPYRCPQCNGAGTYSKRTVKPYPKGLPDSGWVPDEIIYVPTTCELCDGHGWVDKEYKPKMVQDGWE